MKPKNFHLFSAFRKTSDRKAEADPQQENLNSGILSEEEAYERLSNEVFRRLLNSDNIGDDEVRRLINLSAAELSMEAGFDLQARRHLRERVFNRLRRLDLLQPLLDDPEVTEIMVNGSDKIFFEKKGRLFRSPQRFLSSEHLQNVICSFFGRYNQELSQTQPLASLRLPDGSRAHAVLPPIAPDGPILTIRKFSGIRPDLNYLIEDHFIEAESAELLIEAVRQRRAVIIGGGTGSGKTTLLNILSAYIPADERIITIEDQPELRLQNRMNWVRLNCRPSLYEGAAAVDSALLIRNALRMRPDRIIVGEVRGSEAYDMLQAAMTGHPGTLCTIHGNSCEGMLSRLADLILAASRLSYESILRHLAESFDFLVHIRRDARGQRFIDEIAEIKPSAPSSYQLITHFRREE